MASYSTAARAQDLLATIDALELDHADLIAHGWGTIADLEVSGVSLVPPSRCTRPRTPAATSCGGHYVTILNDEAHRGDNTAELRDPMYYNFMHHGDEVTVTVR